MVTDRNTASYHDDQKWCSVIMAENYVEDTEDNSTSRMCFNCGSIHTYKQKTKNGVFYKHWYKNPETEGTWLCGKCMKHLRYHGKFPSKEKLTLLREQRLEQRTCYQCNGKTLIQKALTSSYHIWHKNSDVPGTWLCAKCYARRYFAPKKKFQTKEEHYQYLSKLFSGKGNPMYDVHLFGRTYTPERNRKVSESGKKWIAEHSDEHRKKAVKGALKARELGLFCISTRLEKYMEDALKKNGMYYIPQYDYTIGVIDFYLPEANIALFVDGSCWHANPERYKEEDILFFGKTAKEIWEKDAHHNAYLKSDGFTVLRFWDNDIKENIGKCIQVIQNVIQEYKKRNLIMYSLSGNFL
jgi:DNA mismatch endonuclease (patch repair protein)